MSQLSRTKRIAVLGLLLEAHPKAPVTRKQDFANVFVARGERLTAFTSEMGFDSAFGESGACEIVPILVAGAESGGPLLHEEYLDLVGEIEQLLGKAGPLDGVFIYGHGAGQTTELVDMDGDYFERVRAIVGPDVPVVAELDLHAILTPQMVEATNALVSYRTNPHVDQAERARDCARILARLVDGAKTAVVYERVPLLTAQIAQIVREGSVYSDIIREAEALSENPGIAFITLLSGFSLGDTPNTGFSICVTTWGNQSLAEETCRLIAQKTWDQRNRFLVAPTSIDDAVAIEREHQARSVPDLRIYADIADNPGGGGRGNTIHLVRAMAEAGLANVVAGVLYDPALAARAWQVGEGASFEACFNSEEPERSSGQWTTPVRVEKIFDTPFSASEGVKAGAEVDLGRSCVLSIDDGRVRIVVCSLRRQTMSPSYFTVAGIDVRQANAVIVKSRGHFRAAFEPLTRKELIYEVDGPGLTTAALSTFDWKRISRPIFPLDEEFSYAPRPHARPCEEGVEV